MTLVEAVKFPVSPTSEKEFGKDQSPAPRADLQESKTQAWEFSSSPAFCTISLWFQVNHLTSLGLSVLHG